MVEQEQVTNEAPPCCGGGDFYGHEPYCDCGHVLAEKATAKYIEDLRTALAECGTSTYNPDTCGVCRLHFAECEAEQRAVGDVVDEHDIPVGREPACGGARARALLKG